MASIVTYIFAIIYRYGNVSVIFLSLSLIVLAEAVYEQNDEIIITFHDLIYCVYCWLRDIHIFMYAVAS